MKKILYVILLFFVFKLNAKLEVTEWTSNLINVHSVSVAFDNLDSQGKVTCVFKNKDKKPINKITGWIDGVGVLEKLLPSEMSPKYVSCYAN